jgi:thymidylate synthase
MHEGYFDVLAKLFAKGKRQPSRNGETLEVEDLIVEVEYPEYNAPDGVRPGYNFTIGLVEGLQLLAGISDSGLTAEIQPQFRAYMDDGKFWGAYGPRTVDQFPIITERLRADADTRQAVITLWDPEFDAQGGKKDHPCTTAFFFLVRNGALNMKVVMRSVDLYWGLPYDVTQFALVQLSLARVLGLAVGTYTHHGVSAHLYEPHWDVAKDTLKNLEITKERQPLLALGEEGGGWESVQDSARTILRVVTGTLGAEALASNAEQHYAQLLLERKVKVSTQNLEKVRSLDKW